MKMNLAAAAPLLAVAMGFSGCVSSDDYRPGTVGFQPPTIPPEAPGDPLPVDPGVNPNPAGPAPGALPDPLPAPSVPVNPSPLPTTQPPVTQPPAPAPTPAPPLPPEPPKPQPPKVAKRAPSKDPNQVLIYNPYTGKVLDVTGFPPNSEVRDPSTGHTMLVP